jgi:hypothetical protein
MGQTSITRKAGLRPAAESTSGSAMKSKAPGCLLEDLAFHMIPLKAEKVLLRGAGKVRSQKDASDRVLHHRVE